MRGSGGGAKALRHPFRYRYYTATTRGGSRPSWYLDLYGVAEGVEPEELRYARVRVSPR